MVDEEVLKIVTDLCTAIESAVVNTKRQIATLTGASSWDPNKIRWVQAEGASGPYERSEDINNLQFKAMVKDLAAHNDKMTRNGYFYWLFKNGAVVGRKKRKR